VNVETSQPSSWLVRKCFHTYIKLFVKAVGGRISGARNAYTYLATTISRFYSAEDLADIMSQAGFEKVTYKKQLFGVVAIHRASKL
jgi:demethylmenaquinone methyltransferase/2-methoxy-6-polyprenyl-1,4-benzoquinol methylase